MASLRACADLYANNTSAGAGKVSSTLNTNQQHHRPFAFFGQSVEHAFACHSVLKHLNPIMSGLSR